MNENQLAPKKTFSKIGIILLLVIVITNAVQLIISYFVNKLIPDVVYYPWYVWSLTVISLYLVAFPIYLKVMKKLPDFELKCERKYSAKEIVTLVFICLSATYLCNFVSVGINLLIGFLKGSAVVNPLEVVVGSSSVFYTIIVACIMAPIVEEIMFRKVMINKLVGYGEKTAIIVSSFAFAMFHGNLYQILYAFVLGAIFAHITISSGTIKYSIILHIIINLLGSVIIPYFAMSENTIIVGITGLAVIFAIVVGILLFSSKRKILLPQLKEQALIEGQEPAKVSTVLLSEGMIAFWVISIVLIIISVFLS